MTEHSCVCNIILLVGLFFTSNHLSSSYECHVNPFHPFNKHLSHPLLVRQVLLAAGSESFCGLQPTRQGLSGHLSAGAQLPHRRRRQTRLRVGHLCERSSVRSLRLAGECRQETERTAVHRLPEPHSVRHWDECDHCSCVQRHGRGTQQVLCG